jgi:putative ABC transport system substrate-binding protein
MTAELMPKLLELLIKLVPQARVIALLVHPEETSTERILGQMQGAARATRVDLRVLKARTETEIDGAVATLVQVQADGARPRRVPRCRAASTGLDCRAPT